MSLKPTMGDVVITTKDDRHFLSLFPDRARLSFRGIERAYHFATLWATAQRVQIWRSDGNRVFRIDADESQESAAS